MTGPTQGNVEPGIAPQQQNPQQQLSQPAQPVVPVLQQPQPPAQRPLPEQVADLSQLPDRPISDYYRQVDGQWRLETDGVQGLRTAHSTVQTQLKATRGELGDVQAQMSQLQQQNQTLQQQLRSAQAGVDDEIVKGLVQEQTVDMRQAHQNAITAKDEEISGLRSQLDELRQETTNDFIMRGLVESFSGVQGVDPSALVDAAKLALNTFNAFERDPHNHLRIIPKALDAQGNPAVGKDGHEVTPERWLAEVGEKKTWIFDHVAGTGSNPDVQVPVGQDGIPTTIPVHSQMRADERAAWMREWGNTSRTNKDVPCYTELADLERRTQPAAANNGAAAPGHVVGSNGVGLVR